MFNINVDEKDLINKIGNKPNGVQASARFKTEEIAWVHLEHGLNTEGDFIIHIKPSRKNRNFPHTDNILQLFQQHIIVPDHCNVDVYPPSESWDIKIITIAFRKLGKHWSFNEQTFLNQIKQACRFLSSLMDELHQKRGPNVRR